MIKRRCLPASASVLLLLAFTPSRAPGAEFTHPTERYTIAYPDDWHIHHTLLATGGPLELSNIPLERYLHGGILPPGGADITVQVLPGDRDENEVLEKLRTGQVDAQRSRQTLAGGPAERLQYSWDMGSDLSPATMTKVAIVRKISGKTFLIQLAYRQEGANPLKWEEVLSQVASSISPSREE